MVIFFAKILLKTFQFVITNISELDFEEKKSDEIVLHPMHGAPPALKRALWGTSSRKKVAPNHPGKGLDPPPLQAMPECLLRYFWGGLP